MTNIELLKVEIDLLKLAKWDVRKYADTEEESETIKNSIKENGLIYPLTVAKMNNPSNGDLVVIAERRRLRALKELEWKTVPVLVQFENVTETELRRIP